MAIKPPFGSQEVVPLTKDHRVILPKDGELPAAFRNVTAILLSMSEFAFAARDCPIAFVADEEGRFLAMAVLGLEGQQNLFVTADGGWEPKTYVPTYVRRYPFCMMRVMDAGKEWAERKKLLLEFEVDLGCAEDMSGELGVLEPFAMQAVPNHGAPLSMTGMHRVNEEKLNAIAPEKIHELMRKGIRARVYMHVFSLGNFGRLLDRRAAGATTRGSQAGP